MHPGNYSDLYSWRFGPVHLNAVARVELQRAITWKKLNQNITESNNLKHLHITKTKQLLNLSCSQIRYLSRIPLLIRLRKGGKRVQESVLLSIPLTAFYPGAFGTLTISQNARWQRKALQCTKILVFGMSTIICSRIQSEKMEMYNFILWREKKL